MSWNSIFFVFCYYNIGFAARFYFLELMLCLLSIFSPSSKMSKFTFLFVCRYYLLFYASSFDFCYFFSLVSLLLLSLLSNCPLLILGLS